MLRSKPINTRMALLGVMSVSLSAFVAAASRVPASGAPKGSSGPHPISGLSKQQMADFDDGLDQFTEVHNMEKGLGPVFNGRSCAECHAQPFTGGSSPDLHVSRVTRIGRLLNGVFDPLTEEGGMLLQARSVAEIDPTLPIHGEVVPPDATFISHRITTPLFGAGLIEAIPDSEILKRGGGRMSRRDGVAGVPNIVVNADTGATEIGRFGWKGNVSTLHVFAGDAYLNEIGITNPSFPNENLPQGQPIPPGTDLIAGLEDDGTDVNKLANFMRYLAPPQRQTITQAAKVGERIFDMVGCTSCHTPSLMTGDSPIAALRRRPVPLYSDLLLHDMGEQLADGMVMGSANGRQWRTAPLWGLGERKFFLHDGRATTLESAILSHGGEATMAVRHAQQLNSRDQAALLSFLHSL